MKKIVIIVLIGLIVLITYFFLKPLIWNECEDDIPTSNSEIEQEGTLINYPFWDDFENGDITPWILESLPEDWSSTYVEAPGGRDGLCRRAEIRKEVTILGRPRAEYTIHGSAWAKDNAERWFGVGIFVPEDFEPGTVDKFVNMFHLHATPDFDLGEDWRYGLHHLGVYKKTGTNQLTWSYNYNSQCAEAGTYEDVVQGDRYDLGIVEKGVWNDFVIYIKFAYCEDQGGHLKLWMNEDIDSKTPSLETFGPNCYNDQNGPYVKMGMQNWNYKKMPEWTTPLVIYYDNWRMDDEDGTLSSVDPGTRH